MTPGPTPAPWSQGEGKTGARTTLNTCHAQVIVSPASRPREERVGGEQSSGSARGDHPGLSSVVEQAARIDDGPHVAQRLERV